MTGLGSSIRVDLDFLESCARSLLEQLEKDLLKQVYPRPLVRNSVNVMLTAAREIVDLRASVKCRDEAIARQDVEISKARIRSQSDADTIARLINERTEAEERSKVLLESLDRSCAAIDAFGFDSDSYGGPYLSECIEKLGAERDELRKELEASRERGWDPLLVRKKNEEIAHLRETVRADECDKLRETVTCLTNRGLERLQKHFDQDLKLRSALASIQEKNREIAQLRVKLHRLKDKGAWNVTDEQVVEALCAIETGLSGWEMDFIESVAERVAGGTAMTEDQRAKAVEILQEKAE